MLPKTVQNIVDLFYAFPGVGPKSAERMALYMLKQPRHFRESMIDTLGKVADRVHECTTCFSLSEESLCNICSDPAREKTTLCVVEEYTDVIAVERAHIFKGQYHVLGGRISPLHGVGPRQLHIDELLERVAQDPEIEEIILATNPNLEGEATALFIKEHMNAPHIRLSRIARGLPTGGDLEYADEKTISSSLTGRVSY